MQKGRVQDLTFQMSELHGCTTTKKFKDMRKNTQETNLKSGKVEIKPKENGLGKIKYQALL